VSASSLATGVTFRLNGTSLIALAPGALWWPARSLLAIADLHLEKGSEFAMRGRLLPPYDSDETLRLIAVLTEELRPERVICLGDSFHDRKAVNRLPRAIGDRIAGLASERDWIWIAGNHDPAPPEGWGGRVAAEFAEGPLRFRHEATLEARPAGEISGHYHPKAGISWRGRRVVGRCFVEDGRRLVLPAFGAYAGGLDARDAAIAGLFPDGYRVHILGRQKLHSFPASAL